MGGIISMENMHKPGHFSSLFIVTWSQNEPPESPQKMPFDKDTNQHNRMKNYSFKCL